MALNNFKTTEDENKSKSTSVNASELSKVNPVAKAIKDYGDTVPASVKQERIANRQAQFLKSFGGQRAPVMQAGTSPSMEVAKPVAIAKPAAAVPLREINKRSQFANSANEPKTLALYEPPKLATINAPRINEVPNVQRDKELGKLNVATSGNRTTFNIGGNTLSYNLSERDKQLKSNLARINEMVASGANVSPEQMTQINELRQQAGFLRGGTDRRDVGPDGRPVTNLRNINAGRVGNLDVQFTGSADNTEARKREFLTPSSYAQSQIDLIKPRVVRNIPGTNQYEETVGQSVEDKRMQGVAQQRRLEQLTLDPKMDEARSNIKLQDIQGQVLQNPPTKESALKPMTIKTRDELGNEVEKIMIPNAEGTGYVDGMQQTAFTVPKPATTQKLLKMRAANDPNLAAAEAEYKTRFGSLPY